MGANRKSICAKCAKLRLAVESCVVVRGIIISMDGPTVLAECKDELYAFPIKPGNSCPYFVKMVPDEMKGENDA